ncbi:MAG: hypothetical protein RMM08_06055 [Armatimonadota bacterium]|nr:hypothetical protein [bacterium]MDW8320908.1 hypothetical protein [Armatimonadota bacterium]
MRLSDDLVHEEIYRLLVRESGQATCFSFVVLGALVAGAALGGAIATVSPGVADPQAMVLTMMVVAGIVAYAYRLVRSRAPLSPDDVRRLLPLLRLDEGEQAYMDVLLALGEHPSLVEETAEQIARELKDLLDAYYDLQNHLDGLREAMGTASEEEYESLRKRLEQTEDVEARAALEESLQLLAQRLKNRQALSTYVQRMEAHLELILQTLKSLRESLARLKLAPEGTGTLDVEQLRRRLLELRQEASAIESAAQEVLAATGYRNSE